jgi:hypothetical protein
MYYLLLETTTLAEKYFQAGFLIDDGVWFFKFEGYEWRQIPLRDHWQTLC